MPVSRSTSNLYAVRGPHQRRWGPFGQFDAPGNAASACQVEAGRKAVDWSDGM